MSLPEAWRLYEAGDYVKGAILAAQVADAEPKNGHAFHILARCYQQMGHRAKAFDYYAQALDLIPDEPSLHFNIGTAAWSLGLYEGAAKALRGYMAMRPDCSVERLSMLAVSEPPKTLTRSCPSMS